MHKIALTILGFSGLDRSMPTDAPQWSICVATFSTGNHRQRALQSFPQAKIVHQSNPMNMNKPTSPSSGTQRSLTYSLHFPRLKLLLCLCFPIWTGSLAQAQTTYVQGNLQVSGTADFLNNTLTFGSLTGNNSGEPGFTITFTDNSGSNPATIQFTASRSAQQWLWTQQASGSSAAPMMMLDSNNKLELYSTSNPTTPSIVLDPNTGQITLNGQTFGGGSGSLASPRNILSPYQSSSLEDEGAYFPSLVDSSGNISIDPTGRILYDPNGNNVFQFDGNGGAATGMTYATAFNSESGGWSSVFYGTRTDNSILVYNPSTNNYLFLGYREADDAWDHGGYGGFLQSPNGLVRIEGTNLGSRLLLDSVNGIVGGVRSSVNYFGNYGDGYGDDADVAFFTSAYYGGGVINERMRIQGSTGNVGINTTTPTAMLDVEGDGRFTGPVHLEPQGDLSMGDFTYDPNSQGNNSNTQGAASVGTLKGSGMANQGTGGTSLGSGSASLSGTTTSGSSSY